MHVFQPLPVDMVQFNPFTSIGTDWALVAATKDGKTNAMTISWGAVGVIWKKNVAFVFIRDSRYTKEFVDGSDYFSVNFFGGKEKNALKYFGAVSGRTEDKIAATGFHVNERDGITFFDESNFVLICRKLSATKINPEDFIDPEIIKQYPIDDYHTMYIGEIVEFLGR